MTVDAESRVSTPNRQPKAEANSPAPTTPSLAPVLPSRRNPKWIALGIVALCLGALLSYVIYAKVADQASVVAMVNTVQRGETVTAADLRTVSLPAADGVRAVAASELDQLVGRKAVFDLVAGSLLPAGAIADVVVPSTGRAVVGVRLVAGRAPAGTLPSGSPLRLVALPAAGSESSPPDQYTGRTIVARTISQVEGTDGTSVIVNVDVPAATAPAVALLAAQERLALVRDADR